MNILEGDLLVIGTKNYPIRSCAEWATTRMNTAGFRRMATLTVSTMRTKKGEPTALLSSLRCTPLDPVDSEIRRRLALDTPHELLQTFITDGSGFVHLVLEDIKR